MKHIIFLICALFACSFTSNAQVRVSTRDLNGTKWQCLSSIYEYKNGKEIWHRKDGSSFTYQFYLSDQMPEAFDFSKVGKNTQGRYLIEYNSKQDIFFSYAILRFNKKEKIMALRLDTKNVIGNSGVASFTLISENTRPSRGTTTTPPNSKNKALREAIR